MFRPRPRPPSSPNQCLGFKPTRKGGHTKKTPGPAKFPLKMGYHRVLKSSKSMSRPSATKKKHPIRHLVRREHAPGRRCFPSPGAGYTPRSLRRHYRSPLLIKKSRPAMRVCVCLCLCWCFCLCLRVLEDRYPFQGWFRRDRTEPYCQTTCPTFGGLRGRPCFFKSWTPG